MSSILEEDRPTPWTEPQTAEAAPAGLRVPAVSHAFWPAVALVASLGLALRGQQLVTNREYPLDGPIYFALAVGLFLWAITHWPDTGPLQQVALPLPRAETPARPLVVRTEYRLWLTGATIVLAALAYRGFAGNHFSTMGVIAWFGALACFLAVFAEPPAGDWRKRIAGWWRRDPFDPSAGLRTSTAQDRLWTIQITWVHLALMGITLLAIFFRVYRLADVPAEMTSDHAEKLLDVNDVLHGMRPIFFPRNTGREAFQFYLTAALIRFTPLTLSHLALKVGTALFGILAVPLTYLLGRELYDRRVGLLAATLLAISHWHVAITRVGLRFPFTAAFAVPTLYFLFRAFKHNRRNDWLACGLVLGVGLHTYTAMRTVPLLLMLLVGIKVIADFGPFDRFRAALRIAEFATHDPPPVTRHSPLDCAESSALKLRFWENGVLAGVASLLVFLPLLRYMRDEPRMFWYRVLSRSSNLERQVPGEMWRVFWGNVKNALLMFNYKGDMVWVNTVPGSPALGWVTASLFVLGMAYLLWRLVEHSDRRTLYLLASLFMLLLPSILSLAYPNENPSVVRGGGAAPIAMLIAALPLSLITQRLSTTFSKEGQWMAGLLIAGLLIVAVRYNYNWYFVKYDQQFRQSAWNTTEMGRVVRGFADSVGDMAHAYHVAYPYWADTRNIAINAGDITWRNAILDIQQAQAHANDPAPKLYLLHVDDQKSLAFLQSLFPDGQVTRYRSKTPGKDFLVYFVPGALR